MDKELRILMVEDVLADAELEVRALKRAGLRVTHRLVETEEAFREALREFRPELIISDFSMPHFDGMFALALAHELSPDVPFIFVSGTIGEDYAIRALKNGATDYVLKNNLVRLPAAVERALQDAKARVARRRAEEDQSRLAAIVENSNDAIISRDLDRKITFWNAAAERLFGYTAAEVIGRDTSFIIPPEAEVEAAQKRELLQQGRPILPFDSVRLTQDGRRIDVSVSQSPINDASGKMIGVSLVFRDISERKSHELKIARLSRIHAVLSGINSAIVRIRGRQQMFEEACRIAVEHGKFTMSWIGMLDEAAQVMRPVARMGSNEGYLERLNLTMGPNNTGNLDMAVEAVGRLAPVVCNDIATDGRMRPWRAAALERGYRSSAIFPLMLEQRAVGVFVLYAPEPGFFDEEEMKLLAELAGDISFALEHIAGQEKIEKLTRIHVISSEINAAIVRIRDRQKLFEEACRIAVEHGNFGLAWIGLYDPATLDVTPVAWAGLGSDEMKRSKATARADVPQGQGVLGRAIRERRPVFDNDISVEAGVGGKRRQEALRLGYRSLIVLPLFAEGAVAGILALFAKEPNFFDEEEIKLLTELAGDISFALEHIAKEEKLEKLSRIRAVSGEINATIVRVHEREALLREVCRIAAEHGKFEFVWVALLDEEKKEVKPVAWTGFSPEAANAVTWATISSAQGTMGEAIQTGKAAARNDLGAELKSGKLRQEALKAGCRSTACLPFVVEDKVVAAINLFAGGRNFFDANELALLEEMASNISFALEHINRQQKIEKLSRIRIVLGEINAAIVRIRDKQELFQEACRIAVEAGRFPFAWLGVHDRDAMQVTLVASAGADDGFLDAMQARWSADKMSPQGGGIAARVISEKKAIVVNDVQNDPRISRKKEHIERNINSVAALPLFVEGEVAGVLALHARETGFFDEEEMKLLSELASDIGFAMQTIGKQEKLDYLSYYDALTGLPNRTLFNDRLEQRVSAARRDHKTFAVMMLDLERFRNVNETLGRTTGDDLLRQVGQRLKNALEETDILAHIGGDHFAIAAQRADEGENVAHFLEKILTTVLGQPFEAGGNELRLAARVGVAVYPEDGTDVESLLKNTEAALNKAKASGERYLFYQPKMNAAVAQTLLLENKLRQALEKEQFVLHYQPKVDLAKGTLIGLEALIRWNDPVTGLVPPIQFIPLLEETGMILEAGRWAIRKALEDYREWRARGLQPPRIAVNVSSIQLRQKNFVDVVREAIGESPAGSHGLDLEITESQIMEDIEGNIEKLRAVRDMGVNIAIDDFGTGYSSLGYLAKLPVNALKIDRSFIITMAKNADSMTIVSAIISLAHSLNLKVIAEGVETEEQAQLLRLLKCDEMQGYLFSRPLPAAEVEAKYLAAAAE